MKRVLSLSLAAAVSISCGIASAATLPKKGPFTFQGTVASAASACPYALGKSVSGYTAVTEAQQYSAGHGKNYIFLKDLDLVFSPGGTASKVVLGVAGFTLAPGATSASGKLKIFSLPSTNEFDGTYKITPTFSTVNTFSAKLAVNYRNGVGVCTASYDLTFARGLPKNLFNLL